MIETLFEDVMRRWLRSRRSLLGTAGLVLGGWLTSGVEAKKKEKKVTLCLNGQTMTVSKKAK